MTRSRPLAAAVLTVVALAVAWLGTAHALSSADPSRADFIDERAFMLAAAAATAFVIGTCLCSWPWGLLASVGVTAGLWWGALETVQRTRDGGWDNWLVDAAFLVPIAAGVVSLIAVVTCVAAGNGRTSSRRLPSDGLPTR